MNKFKAALSVLSKGSMVANPEAWKNGQVTANAVVALLMAIASLTGQDVPSEVINSVGVGLFAAVNWVFTTVSTDKVGLLPSRREPNIKRRQDR